MESREIWGIWFWFFGWLFNMLHHGLGVLDFKQQRTQVKLGRKGVCRKTGGSSERKLMWRANLAPPRWEPGDSRPQQREPLLSLSLSLPQKEGFWFFFSFVFCSRFKVSGKQELIWVGYGHTPSVLGQLRNTWLRRSLGGPTAPQDIFPRGRNGGQEARHRQIRCML